MRRRSSLYRGRTADERRTERRGRLIRVASDIWREAGWAAVTMRLVCSHASLNARYFYADFADRDALLVAVWNSVRNDLLGELVGKFVADQARPTMRTLRELVTIVVDWVAADPMRAQILLGSHSGCAALERRRAASLREVIDLVTMAVRPHLREGADETGLHVDIVVGVTGFVGLISGWHAGVVELSKQDIVDQSTRLGSTLASQYMILEPA